MLPLDRASELPRTGPEIWVRRLAASEELQLTCSSPCFWLFWVHWAGDHSLPCFQDHKACPGHRQGLPRRVRGYVYGWVAQYKKYEFLELPPSTVEKTQELLMPSENLRGKVLRYKRGNGRKAGIKVSRVGEATGENFTRLAADRDPAATLVKLWGLEDLPNNSAAKPSIAFAS